MTRLPAWIAQSVVSLRFLVMLTLTVGLAFPLALTGFAQIAFPHRADGSFVDVDGTAAGSDLIGQSFTDQGNPIPTYFQGRPSAAGAGYDPTASAAGNQGPQSVVDVLADPGADVNGKQSLLTQVCSRSKAIGELEQVDGTRPFCTPDGVGAVLGVFRQDGLTGRATRVVSLNHACPATPFLATFEGATIECAIPGADYGRALLLPVRGDAPTNPAVPPDAVTGSASGLDPHISPAYALLQAPRVARERGIPLERVKQLIAEYTTSRALGFLGEPTVNVLPLNLALDRES